MTFRETIVAFMRRFGFTASAPPAGADQDGLSELFPNPSDSPSAWGSMEYWHETERRKRADQIAREGQR